MTLLDTGNVRNGRIVSRGSWDVWGKHRAAINLTLPCDEKTSVQDLTAEPLPQTSRVLYSSHDLALGACRDMFFVLWQDRTTLEGVATLETHFEQYSRNRLKDLALITIVASQAHRSPPAQVRHRLAAWLSDSSSKLLISAVVFEGDGFAAAMVRGVVIGLSMLAKPNFPHRVVSSVWHAGGWFEEATLGMPKVFTQNYVMARVSEFRQAAPLRPSIPM